MSTTVAEAKTSTGCGCLLRNQWSDTRCSSRPTRLFDHNQLESLSYTQPSTKCAGAAEDEVQQKQGFATGVAHPQPAEDQDVPGAAGGEVQQKQGFATGVAHPQPAEDQDVPGAAGGEVQQKQGFATGVAHPQPAELQDVPGAAAGEVQQKEASAPK